MYEFTSRVRYSEIQPDGTMSLGAMLTRMQDCSVFHSDSIGRGPECWLESGFGWLIISWQVKIHSRPVFGTPITTRTWSYRFRGIEGDRIFTIRDDEGRTLAEANSRWIYFNRVTQKPARVPAVEIEGFGEEEPLADFSYSNRKIRLPEAEPVVQEAMHIQPINIDTNGHVNNLVYIDMAVAYLPADFEVGELRVQYLRQAMLGDVLVPKCYAQGESYFVSLENGGGEICAIVEFMR